MLCMTPLEYFWLDGEARKTIYWTVWVWNIRGAANLGFAFFHILWPALIHVMVHREDFVERIFVGVQVYHPPEDRRPEAPAGRIASILSSDRAFQAELGPVCVA